MKTVDMHCDTISRSSNLKENNGHLDLVKMQKGDYLLQNFAAFVDTSKYSDPWQRVCELINIFNREIEKNSELISPVYCFDDIENNMRAGKMSALLTVEEGAVCGGDINKLKELYMAGVRMMTLTWNYPNELGNPNYRSYGSEKHYHELKNIPDTENGLTEKGKEFVCEMVKMGMIPDVSHLSDAGFFDVAELSQKPFVASHSNARAICRNVRNLTDQMIRVLAEKGGVMGLNYCPDFLKEGQEGKPNPGTIEDIILHAKHITNTGGIEVLGLGSDFDGIDGHSELRGAHDMGKLWDAFIKNGFSESQTDKIFSENVLRVYKDFF